MRLSRRTGALLANRHHPGFTLIEVLVVVAILALLIAILLPSLQRAKEQAKTAVCLSNLHQMGFGFSTYASDHRQNLPMRLGYTYALKYRGGPKNVRVLCNIGLLYGKYCGKDLDFYYCVSNEQYAYDDPVYGSPGFFIEGRDPYVTWSGYMYAAPVAEEKSPREAGKNAYPREVWRDLYAEWVETQTAAGANVGNENIKALVADNLIGCGGEKAPHKGVAFNVLFTDYHAKPVRDPDRQLYRGLRHPTSGTGGAPDLYYYWDLFTKNP